MPILYQIVIMLLLASSMPLTKRYITIMVKKYKYIVILDKKYNKL